MNRNSTPIILLILAIGIYFTFTKGKVEELKTIKNVNAGYQEAIENSEKLMKVRDDVQRSYNEIDDIDKERLEKMLPNNIDNVRLTLDVKSIGLSRGLVLRNVKTDAPNINTGIKSSGTNGTNARINNVPPPDSASPYDTVLLTFNVTTNYLTFLELIKDLETSLRIIDISKIDFTVNDTGTYDYSVELRTYWLK